MRRQNAQELQGMWNGDEPLQPILSSLWPSAGICFCDLGVGVVLLALGGVLCGYLHLRDDTG